MSRFDEKKIILNFKSDLDKPNKEKLQKFINRHYIKKIDYSDYSVCEALFRIKEGSIFFCRKKQKTIFDPYGPGIPLYFIFLRTIMLFLFIASLFSFWMMSKNRNSNSTWPTLTTPIILKFVCI